MKRKVLKRKYKTYTDPYAIDWYESIYRPSDWDLPGSKNIDRKQSALNAADYIESMYRHHQRKYLHNRDSVENSPNFIGPVSPKNYISPNTKEALQFKNFDSRFYGTYNDNYPNMPTDYDKYKFGGNKRIKNNRNKSLLGAILAGSAISGLGSIIQGIISGNATRRATEQQLRQQTLSGNLQNSITQQNNIDEAANYSNNNDAALERMNELDTLHTAMCFGGKRRMKKAGGTISANIKGLGRYI